MKKVIPLVLNLDTARAQAEYYFNREFQTVSLDLLKTPEGGYEIEPPSDKVIINQYFEDAGSISAMFEEYRNESCDESFDEDNWQDDEAFIEYAVAHRDFDEYKYGDFASGHYPMWGWVFACQDFYIDSDYMDTDKLYEVGIGVLMDTADNYYLFISGCGYDFYDMHWIPLFKKLGWIKEEEIINE